MLCNTAINDEFIGINLKLVSFKLFEKFLSKVWTWIPKGIVLILSRLYFV